MDSFLSSALLLSLTSLLIEKLPLLSYHLLSIDIKCLVKILTLTNVLFFKASFGYLVSPIKYNLFIVKHERSSTKAAFHHN